MCVCLVVMIKRKKNLIEAINKLKLNSCAVVLIVFSMLNSCIGFDLFRLWPGSLDRLDFQYVFWYLAAKFNFFALCTLLYFKIIENLFSTYFNWKLELTNYFSYKQIVQKTFTHFHYANDCSIHLILSMQLLNVSNFLLLKKKMKQFNNQINKVLNYY